MKLTDAFIGSQLVGIQRSSATAQAIILRSPGGFQLSRLTVADGQRQAKLWTFTSLYDLLLFAQVQGVAEVDPDAEDWQPVAASCASSGPLCTSAFQRQISCGMRPQAYRLLTGQQPMISPLRPERLACPLQGP